MYYVRIERRYIRLLGNGVWSLTKYRNNATTFSSHEVAAKYAATLTDKGHKAGVSGCNILPRATKIRET